MMKRINEIAMALSLVVILAALPAPVRAVDFRLGVSDRVKIKVQEWPDITGEYTVTPDGAVSLPLVGDINAVGLSLNELAQRISDRLKQRSKGSEQVLTAVEIAQYRPFAIMGDVQKPGQYPYRPGLTVLEAISIAGGYYRPELGPAPARSRGRAHKRRHQYTKYQAEPADRARSATERGAR